MSLDNIEKNKRIVVGGVIIICFVVLGISYLVKTNHPEDAASVNINENSNDTEQVISYENNQFISEDMETSKNVSTKEVITNAEGGEELDFIDDEVVHQLEDKSDEDLWKEKYGKVTEFVKLKNIGGMDYNLVKDLIKKDQLPVLYELLNDEEYSPYWHKIARIIGFISDDPCSIPVLLKYYQRDDGNKVESVVGKVWSIALIGKIGGDSADPILRKAITKEGAEELAKLWIDEAKWNESETYDKNYVIKYTQNAAIKGLIYTGKQEDWDIVEKLYNEHKEITSRNQRSTDIMPYLISAMATKAFIEDNDNDVEAYFRMDNQDVYKNLKKYLDKYDPLIDLIKAQAQSQ